MNWRLEDLSAQDRQLLQQLEKNIRIDADHLLGYPCTSVFNYQPLLQFLDFPLNNIGDPYVSSVFKLNTHQFEKQVLETFCEWTHADKNSAWGYVTNGGTEGNMYGIFLAREMFPEGVVYYSEDTHYSVTKSLRVLHVRNIMIKSQENGEMDYDDLRETIRIHRDVTPIIFANIGTTMKGAIDNIATIREILRDLAIHHYYIHADAALSGMILPFVEHPPAFDFAHGIQSISISGHKMIGSPIPCGVVLADKANVDRIARSIEYVGTLDTTLTGSRNAITPLFLWYALKTVKFSGFQKIIKQCIEIADYTISELAKINVKAWRNPFSITVVLPRPNRQIQESWQLAAHDDLAHIITMPQVTRRHIDQFVADLKTQ